MHIKRVYMEHFRRFTGLEIIDIPAKAKLVMLAGPNGNGKSSLFDMFLRYMDRHVRNWGWDQTYHTKITDSKIVPPPDRIDVEFHENDRPDNPRKFFYFRSAYRNDPECAADSITQLGPALGERRFGRMIDNDATVASNYRRLYAQGLEDVFEKEDDKTTIGEFRGKIVGDIQKNLQKVLPELSLEGLGNPLKTQSFRFNKGASKHFNYKNLSGVRRRSSTCYSTTRSSGQSSTIRGSVSMNQKPT
jgi:hypothetical protein